MLKPRILHGFAAALILVLAGTGHGRPDAAAGPPLQPGPDPARMMATVRHFSEDDAGQPISRFAYRVEMNALEDDLRARMAEALGARGTAVLWPFPSRHAPGIWDPVSAAACGSLDPTSAVHAHPTTWPAGGQVPFRTTFQNVIGRLPGANPGAGKFVICSHFDAIGTRTPDWRGWIDPAPGSDDNLSGTAAVLELARILAMEPPLPFDLEFVCFDGEELGLWGSDTLAHAERAANAPILGVFNMDMIGYNPRADSLVVMTNRSSWYLANYVHETEAAAPQPNLTFRLAIDNLLNSDHGPYWTVGYAGFLLIESLQIVRHNPQYHQVTDRATTLSRNGTMMAKAATIYLNALRRLAQASTGPPELRIHETDLVVAVNGSVESRVAAAGDSVRIDGGIFNAGGDTGGEPVTVRYFGIENDGSRRLLFSRTITENIRNGGHLRVRYTRLATTLDVGALTIDMEIQDARGTRTARRAIPIKDQVSRVVSHYMAPNPVRNPGQATLQYELSLDATVRITVFDMHGEELGRQYYRTVTGTRETSTTTLNGLNHVTLSELLAGSDPAPGIYLYRIEVFADGVSGGDVALGKFAILR